MSRTGMKVFMAGTVIGLTALAYGAAGEPTQDPIAVHSTGSVHDVVLTADGFQPSDITIQVGDSIRFSSQVDRHFWPASNIHPHHHIFPEFDPQRPLASDETWTFQFETEGEWLFHDHIDATITGVVRVAHEEGDASACAGDEGNAACWVVSIKQALDQQGLDAAFREVKRLHDSHASFASHCHGLMHDLGLQAFAKYDEDVALTEDTAFCNGGFYHGYMEGFLTKYEDPQDARAFCDRVGAELDDVYVLAWSQCNHGIGHGIMEHLLHTEPELWSDPLAAADITIEFCDETITEDEVEKFRCASGAYSVLADWMLFETNIREAFLTLDDRAFWMCDEAEKSWAQDGCVWELSKRVIARISDVEPGLHTIAQAGERVAEGAYTHRAVRSAADRVGQKLVSDPKDTEAYIDICRDFSEDSVREGCLTGLIDGHFHAASPENEVEHIARFCDAPYWTFDERSFCAEYVLDRVLISAQAEHAGRVCEYIQQPIPTSVESRCASLLSQEII